MADRRLTALLTRPLIPAYDLQAASLLLAMAQQAGRPVAVIDRYHGQFGFYGRLTQPVLYIPDDSVMAWADQHPDAYLVLVYRDHPYDYPQALFSQPYRGSRLVIREARTITARADLPH